MQVTVKTEELLERLEANMETHEKTYLEALKLWREDLQETCEEMDVSDLTSFPRKLKRLEGQCPTSHVKDYEEVIDMFSMSVKEEVVLERSQFLQYCRDEWGWKASAMSNSYYGKASLSV
jgi:vacuolar-type H+-ATPase subunit I/STV1